MKTEIDLSNNNPVLLFKIDLIVKPKKDVLTKENKESQLSETQLIFEFLKFSIIKIEIHLKWFKLKIYT